MIRFFTMNLWNLAKGKFEPGSFEIDGTKFGSVLYSKPTGVDAKKAYIDLGSLFVGPSAIDLHVHSRDFEESHKETFATLEASAVKGGVATVACMANTRPRLDSVSQVREFLRRAASLKIRAIPFAAVSKNLEGKEATDWNSLLKLPIAGLSDDGKPIWDSRMMKAALLATKKAKKLLSLHEEDHSLSNRSEVHWSESSIRLGFEGSPADSEFKMIERDIALAAAAKAHIHIGHVSAAQSVSLIRRARKSGVSISAELTPHHALMNVSDIESASMLNRSLFKVCPVIRSEKDRLELLKAASDGVLDCFASDHAPHSRFEKEVAYYEAAHGIISLENYFSLYNEVRLQSKMSWKAYFSATTYRPATLLGLKSQGQFEKGAPASFVVFDPTPKRDLEWSRSLSTNTPMKNRIVHGQVKMHWILGKLVYES